MLYRVVFLWGVIMLCGLRMREMRMWRRRKSLRCERMVKAAIECVLTNSVWCMFKICMRLLL